MERFNKILFFTLILCFILTPSISAVIQIDNESKDMNSIKMFKNDPSFKCGTFNESENYRLLEEIQNYDIVNNEQLVAEGEFSKEISKSTNVQNSINLSPPYHDRIKSTYNSNGLITSEFYVKPTYYLDANHDQQIIDTTIEKNSISKLDIEKNPNLIEYDYGNIKNNLKTYFNTNYCPNEKSNILSIQDPNFQHLLTWQPVGFYIEPNNNFSELKANRILELITPQGNLNHVNGIVNNNFMEFNNIYPGFTDKYTVLPNKVKHDLILNNYPMSLLNDNYIKTSIYPSDQVLEQDYSFNYYGILKIPSTLTPAINNVKQTQLFKHNNDIELVTENGKIIYKITKPIAYELNSESTQIDCKYTLIPLLNTKANNQGPSIRNLQNIDWSETLVILSTNLAWLQDSNRNYPISIDPDIELPIEGEVGLDTYLTKGNTTYPEISIRNYGKSSELKVSLAGPSIYSKENLYHRSILKFPGVDSLDKEAQIISAKLTLQSMGNSDSLSISIFQLFDDWIEGNGTETELDTMGATWNYSGNNIWLGGNFDGYKPNADTVLVEKPFYYVWDVTDIVEHWVKFQGTNYGFLLSGTDGDDVVKTFHSSEALDYSVRPKLEIEYNTPPRSTGIETIIVSEDVDQEIVYLAADPSKGIDGLFYDPDIFLIPKEDSLSFQMRNESGYLNNDVDVIYTSINVTVVLRKDDKLFIKPSESEVDGLDVVSIRVKDEDAIGWLTLDLTIKVLAVNDPPVIESIGGNTVHGKTEKTVELKATEGIYVRYNINIIDPDNKYLEEDITNKSDGAPANLSFRWEKWKTNTFTINPTEDSAFIGFNPDNSVVGTFYMNITVYDTAWNHSKVPPKDELSNDTVTIIFSIKNTNNPPSNLRIIEPKLNEEFNADDMITFRGKAYDPDLLIPDSKEQLTYSWYSDLDGFLDYGQEMKNKLSKGIHQITLRVMDEEERIVEENRSVLVRNRATIDYKNCSNQFKDEEDDVLCFYYTRTDVDEFNVQRGTFPQFNIFIDIVELSTIRYKNYLFINLTVNQNMLLQEDSSNFKYRFSIYLIRPYHQEDAIDLNNIEYDSKRFETLYRPEPNDYYGLFSKDDGEITDGGTKLVIKKHLGDLENGDGIDAKLQPDFTVYAIIKVELKQHPGDNFEHIICYDSAGEGAQLAPYPKKTDTMADANEEGQDDGLIFYLFLIVIIIIVIIIVVLFSRYTKKAKAKEEEKIIDTTKLPPGTQIPIPPMGVPGPMGMPFNVNMGRPGFPIPPPILPMGQQQPQGQPGMVPFPKLPPPTPDIGGKLPVKKTKKTKGKK